MDKARQSEFERVVLPHLGAAYSLARWLLRQPQDAEDAVQDGLLKAYRAFDSHAGANAAAWLLAIVRNTCLTMLDRRRADRKVVVLDDVVGSLDRMAQAHRPQQPVAQDEALIREERRAEVHGAVAMLPVQFREVIVLREFHDLSYREIADIVGAPVGTVMSRLARARERLKDLLDTDAAGEGSGTSR